MIDTYYIVKQYNAEKYLGFDRDKGNTWVNSYDKATTFANETKEEILNRLDEVFETSNIFNNIYFELIEICYVPKDNYENYSSNRDNDLPF